MRKKHFLQLKKNQKKRNSLVNAFLFFNYSNKTEKEKKKYRQSVHPKIIARTMRLEGEWMSEKEVREIISTPLNRKLSNGAGRK